MPRYLFHIVDGREDHLEVEMVDIAAVKRAVVKTAGKLLSYSDDHLWTDGKLMVRVKDDTGKDVLNLQVVAAEAQQL